MKLTRWERFAVRWLGFSASDFQIPQPRADGYPSTWAEYQIQAHTLYASYLPDNPYRVIRRNRIAWPRAQWVRA